MQFLKNYKTTAMGFSLAVLICVQPVLTTGEVDWKQVIVGALIGALGFFAKDANSKT